MSTSADQPPAAPASPAAGPRAGGCLCGAVRFRLHGTLGAPVACHCRMCRRQSGHYWASGNLAKADLELLDPEAQLRWYASSAKVRRGFCGRCGSVLFWEPLARDWTSVAMGALDGATGLRLQRHIFVAEQGDYYDIADGIPQNPA